MGDVIGHGSDATVRQLASLLEESLPLARFLESDDCSDEERHRLRELVGPEDFFELTNLLHRLGGRLARDVYRRDSRHDTSS